MKASEIREIFLEYFEQQGHYREKSSSLVPLNDPTLLFTSAGMVQFKNVFTGMEKRSYTRATTAQKCLRAGGKHNDLENVGFTGRHQTFFEMLGNFSFGDYFKKEAIHFAWELVTKKLGLPKDKLYVTIYKDDEEAFTIWHKQEGVPKERIHRFGEKDNFWSAGDVGPCGPCTELYIDRGEKFNTGNPDMDRLGGDGDRFLEFYNLVFMQYNRDGKGNLSPLPKPSVDTGMGLERMTSIIQNVNSNYETDLFMPLIQKISSLSTKKYQLTQDPDSIAMRVIADHTRAVSFLIADGVLPGNEGRGYVLRRILRRAVRYGKNLGFTEPFIEKLVPTLGQVMGAAYPKIKEKADFIRKAIHSEEEKFLTTLENGLEILNRELHKLSKGAKISGETAFLLYDSFGFPLDLTQVIAREASVTVDTAGFDRAMEKQKAQSRAGKPEKKKEASEVYQQIMKEGLTSRFSGYEKFQDEGKLLALIQNGTQVEEVVDGAFEAVFDQTPFYAESGGQVGDRGVIYSSEDLAEVEDVVTPLPGLIVVKGKIKKGKLASGENYFQEVAEHRRKQTANNHTATHLLHWALRKELGAHIKQAGSLVTPDLLRFDFTHFKALSTQELHKIESLVNEKIAFNEVVSDVEMQKDEAIKKGAMALFGEKYGDIVRVIQVGDYSTELCGGTHVTNTAAIRLFIITSETGIAAGVRRITALTGDKAFIYLKERSEQMDLLKEKLKAANDGDIAVKLDRLQLDNKTLQQEMQNLKEKSARLEAQDLLSKIKEKGGIKMLVHRLQTGDAQSLRTLHEQLQSKFSGIIALGVIDTNAQKAFVLVSVSKDLISKAQANKIIEKIAPYIEGRGGGKPELAQAGGTKIAGLDQALAAV